MQLPPCAIRGLQRWFPGMDLTEVSVKDSGLSARLVKRLRRSAITIGRTIFFGEGCFDVLSIKGLALIAHELKHVEQYREEGAIEFLLKYLWDWVLMGFKRSRDLPLEKEAYDLEDAVRQHLGEGFSISGNVAPCLFDERGKVVINPDYQELPLAT